jgi:hypothetical protein
MPTFGRAICPYCRREIGVYVPAGGDGSAAVIRRHSERSARGRQIGVEVCPGSRESVTEWDAA